MYVFKNISLFLKGIGAIFISQRIEFGKKKSMEIIKNEKNLIFDWHSDLELDREVILSCDIIDQIKKLKIN